MGTKYYGYVNESSDTGDGILKLASDAETVAGIISDQAVNPASLKAKLGPQTQYGVLYGQTTSVSLGSTAVGTNGQVLIAASGGAPSFSTITSANNSVVFTTGSNSLDMQTTPGGWVFRSTSSNTTMVKGEYLHVINAVAAINVALPTSPTVGDMYMIQSHSANGGGNFVTITQSAGQTIIFGNTNTTTGVGGSLQSTAAGDMLWLVNTNTNQFYVVSSSGNWTIV